VDSNRSRFYTRQKIITGGDILHARDLPDIMTFSEFSLRPGLSAPSKCFEIFVFFSF